MKTASLYKRTGKALVLILCLYASLTATHRGEFWPFSIYPMFSKAGKPWVKVITRKIRAQPDSIGWKVILSPNHLAGKPLALRTVGTNRNDLANYITQTHHWSGKAIRGLRGLYNGAAQNNSLLIYKVTGALDSTNDSVMVEYVPFLYLSADTARFSNYSMARFTQK